MTEVGVQHCVLYTDPDEARAAGGGQIQPGAMWPAPWYLESDYLSAYYREHNSSRPPMVVKLPDGTEFCVDARTTDGGELGRSGWTVTGEPPLLTVHPSIHILVGREGKTSWHGWLKDGVLTP